MLTGAEKFSKVYSRLNPAQKYAVDAIDGPVMVIAGPGTGKTQVLAARIANILTKTDVKPHNILALTFTDAAAKNMRQRIVDMIGKTGYYVRITTFHSFCKDVIDAHPELFGLDRDAQALTQIERFGLFQDLLQSEPFEVLKPINAPDLYIRDIISAISDLKKEAVTPELFATFIAEEAANLEEDETLKKAERTRKISILAKHRELERLYIRYEQALKEKKRYDFDDMIILVMQAFEQNNELLLEYQEQFQYFLVDEYQDTNTAQNRVVELLASYWEDQPNIFVVGDPHQSIYRFQGASVENMLGFVHTYPQATVITLEIGYRAPQVIYDAAHHLISFNTLTTPDQGSENQEQLLLAQSAKSLVSNKGEGEQIELYAASSDIVEVLAVADEIEKLIKSDVKPEEIAVIYRTNADANLIQGILGQKGIRYDIAGGRNVLEIPEIKELLNLLQLITDLQVGSHTSRLFEVFSYHWFGVDSVASLELTRFAGQQRLMISDVLEKGYVYYRDNCETCLITEVVWMELVTAFNRIKEWALSEKNTQFYTWFLMLIDDSGYLDWVQKQETSFELLLSVQTLAKEVRQQLEQEPELHLPDFLRNLAIMKDFKISLPTEDFNITEGVVKLTTAHSAKGQEWEYVFVIHCLDGKWGNSKKRELLPLPEGILKNTDVSKKEQNEDDRRLFYVAITRAKKKLTISYPKSIVTNGSTKEMIASMFTEEIKGFTSDTSEQRNDSVGTRAQEHILDMLKPKKVEISHEAERAYYQKITKDFVFSITALNDYLKDPQLFLYRHILRVPEPRSEIQAYGTAMHRALEHIYDQWCLKHQSIKIDESLMIFTTALEKEISHSDDFERRLGIGKAHLIAYMNQLSLEKPSIYSLEKSFGRGLNAVFLDDIALTGRIDRIDWIDKKNKTVRVVDYKTGKIRSVNEIEAKTSTAQKDLSERERSLPEGIRGAYKRQLLFYKLLAELDPSFTPTVTQGIFDFVEPDKKTGKFIQRAFDLHQEDVEDLKQLIKVVAREVRDLSFLIKSSRAF